MREMTKVITVPNVSNASLLLIMNEENMVIGDNNVLYKLGLDDDDIIELINERLLKHKKISKDNFRVYKHHLVEQNEFDSFYIYRVEIIADSIFYCSLFNEIYAESDSVADLTTWMDAMYNYVQNKKFEKKQGW